MIKEPRIGASPKALSYRLLTQRPWVKSATPTPTGFALFFTPDLDCSHFVLISIETLGEAYAAGWRLTVRCAFGKRDAMKSVRDCVEGAELDLRTLVWTRGKDFPIARLESRLKCPRCGSRLVRIAFQIPSNPAAMRLGRG
jgi:hypothetical protein